MKKVFVFILAAVGFLSASAQNKAQKIFKMPADADYARGRVLVKIKPEYKEAVAQLASKNSGAIIKDVALNSVAHLVKPELDRHGARKMGARLASPTVDISRYFSLKFDSKQSVEDYINQLYATGYFEIVEPVYGYRSDVVPNDPHVGDQYYLGLIKAFEAWDITQGDDTIVIAIVDSGGNLSHSDLIPNLYKNMAEFPANGIDDDGNGYIDDFQGWDFVGNDTLNLNNSNYPGDNDPSVYEGGDESHGTWVGGCASARANNGIGIAGVGYKTKLLFTKHSADNQPLTDPSVYDAYSGILYAANQGDVKIINCSFGGTGHSQIIQDIINYVVLDRNCLIVAAAGNSNSSAPNYPGAYDNVLSVAATNKNDVRASFSNYGTTVDIAAPGVGIYTTGYNNTYNTVDGTSFSSPITAGAAALVWAKNPTFTALQVAEQLRVTADALSLYVANPDFINKLGKGRLDLQRALTLELPSVRSSNPKLINQNGLAALPGDKAFLSFDFKNYLKSTSSGIQISISSTSSAVSITKSTISPGIIAGGATVSNRLTPFELTIKSGAAANTLVNILITYTDGVYSDYQYQSFYVNPSYIDVTSNEITTTVTGIGRLGYQDTDGSRTQGSGFIFKDNSLLFEMGLIMGTSSSKMYNNVRGSGSGYDQDFVSNLNIKQIAPGLRSYSEIFGEFSEKVSQAVVVDYRSLVMKEVPYDKFVILEYKVKNPSASAMNDFYFGIFSDWDITDSGAKDAASWDATNNLGYVYPAQPAAKPYAGIQVLTGTPVYYAIDNSQSIVGNPFGLYDGFTDTEKFTAISTNRLDAGNTIPPGGSTVTGNDVSHVVSSGPYNIAAGQTITIAFALHAASNFTDLQTSARYADSLYNYTLQAPKLAIDTVSVCYGSPATIDATGATKVNWYKTFTGGVPFHTGTELVTSNLKNDTTFFASNADHHYESVRTAFLAKVKANPKISASGSTTICQGDTVKLSVSTADSTIWNTGQITNTIKAYTAGKYAVLSKDTVLACYSKSDTVIVVVNPLPTAAFAVSGDLKTQIPISFTDQSANAVAWFWEFGDGQHSTDQNPVHTFVNPANSVKLTVTRSNGCTDSKTNPLPLITAIEDTPLISVTIYPNPVASHDLRIIIDNDDMSQSRLVLVNSIGQVILDRDISTAETHVELTIPSTSLYQGLNIVKLDVAGKTVLRKVIKVQ